MNSGEWNAVLQFLEEHNNRGKELICNCSECNGTYIHKRAYINQDGDFVISEDTLMSLLQQFKQSNYFQHDGLDESKYGYYFMKYWNAVKKYGITNEHQRVLQSLVKKEYQNE